MLFSFVYLAPRSMFEKTAGAGVARGRMAAAKPVAYPLAQIGKVSGPLVDD